MPEPPPLACVSWNKDGVLLRVRVQPRASQDAWVGLHGDRLKLRIAAPPVDAAANERLIAFLAEYLGLSKSRIRITHGHASRAKTLLLEGWTLADLPDCLQQRS
jgi:uncharacterized protein (TIGR00251 family)